MSCLVHRLLTRAKSGRHCIRHNNERLQIAIRQTESHRNERDPEAVHVWGCMVEGRLIRIVWYYLYQQDTSSFR